MREKGFTLMELMIVIAIIGISVGISVSYLMNAVRTSGQNSAKLRIPTLIETAINRSFDRGLAHDIEIGTDKMTLKQGTVTIDSTDISSSIIYETTNSEKIINIDDDGKITSTTPFVITAKDSKNYTLFTVTVENIAGIDIGKVTVNKQ